MNVRAMEVGDMPAIGQIAQTAGLFPAEALPEMVEPALAGGTDVWRVVTDDSSAVAGFAFAREEPFTDKVWNVLALAVDPAQHRRGCGSTLLREVEGDLDARMILIETTQLPDQAAARGLYAAMGYGEEGRVRDYYATGEDKVIFRKVMS